MRKRQQNQRVRHLVAKMRQVSSPTLVRRFRSSHSSAQARILSRLARGSEGGGFDVSTGASGGSLGTGSTLGAGATEGGFGAGAFVVGAGDVVEFGFAAAAGVAPGFAGAAGFVGAGFAALVFAAVALRAEVDGGGVWACADEGGATSAAPAIQPATNPPSDDAILPAAAMSPSIPAR